MRFRTKPFEIEAWQFDGVNPDELYGVCGWKFAMLPEYDREDDPEIVAQVFDELHNTWVGVKPGQWIIKGQKGEFYPCDPEIFEAKYERVFTEEEKWATIELDNGRTVRVPRGPLMGREELDRGK